jgi:hypothetical protein
MYYNSKKMTPVYDYVVVFVGQLIAVHQVGVLG